MAALEIVAAGVQATLQDLGRPGFRAFGVPVGGAMDRFALQAVNLLLGNRADAVCIEVLLGGLVLRALIPCSVAICGADLGASIDGKPLTSWISAFLEAGATLMFTGRYDGARAYLGIAGGFAVSPALGSGSTYVPGGFGGLQGLALRPGDRLETFLQTVEGCEARWFPPEQRPAYSTFPTLRCVVGPHQEAFDVDVLAALWSSEYRVSPDSDRMGYRLTGPTLMPRAGSTLPSLGVVPGCIQVPPHGQPVLLMADAQTTGGYPVIATVISADLPLAAQLLPGDAIRFRQVSPAAAHHAAIQRARLLAAIEDADEIEGVPI